MQKRGEEHLGAWFDEWHSTFIKETLNGYALRGELALSGELPKVLVRGELDKVEFLSDGQVRVVDYKTGKPKTRNAIMGQTKNDDGEYYRQLTFYKLLLQLEGKYKMDAAMLDFVQPDTRGSSIEKCLCQMSLMWKHSFLKLTAWRKRFGHSHFGRSAATMPSVTIASCAT